MIRDASIICFAHDWNGDPTSKTHIMRILSESNRILWVNSIGWRRPSVSTRDARRIVSKVRQAATERLVEVAPNLHVMSPLAIPLPGVPGVDAVNAALLAASVRAAARRVGLRDPILWTFMPNTVGLCGRLGESKVIYHCVDEYAAFKGVPREALRRMEDALIRRADLVLTSAESLCRARRPLNPCTYFVSHGVDVAHFSRALDRDLLPAADVADLAGRGPVIGFFGLIAEWIDLELIAELARRRPGWTFVMIGKATVDLAPLRGLANVRLLGQKRYGELPAYCRVFDVGMIPFRIDELTVNVNPLKLREYLAAGLPVVSSDLPEVRKYAELVHVAAGVDGYLRELERALGERSETLDRARVDAMKHESWESRVEEISELVASMDVCI